MSRFELLSDAQWSLIEDLLPVRTGKQGRPFRDARQVVEGIIYGIGVGLPGVMCLRCSGRGRRCGPGIAG
jgi:transposase